MPNVVKIGHLFEEPEVTTHAHTHKQTAYKAI
jgi:hypothetical protein